jgi:hypothetical protein
MMLGWRWKMTEISLHEYRLTLKVMPKENLDNILEGKDSIPRDELHILKGSDIGEMLARFPQDISFMFMARYRPFREYSEEEYVRAGWLIGVSYDLVGFIKDAKLVYNSNQNTPLAINSFMMEEEMQRFRHDFYRDGYMLNLFSNWRSDEIEEEKRYVRFGTNWNFDNPKDRLRDIIDHSSSIPEGELHIREGTEIAERLRHAQELKRLAQPVSLQLRRYKREHIGNHFFLHPRNDYHVGSISLNLMNQDQNCCYLVDMKLVYVKEQRLPLLVNDTGLSQFYDKGYLDEDYVFEIFIGPNRESCPYTRYGDNGSGSYW